MKAKDPEPLIPVWKKLLRLLKNGVPLPEALDAVARETGPSSLRGALEDVAKRVRKGEPLSEAMDDHPGVFPQPIVLMTRTAELLGAKIESAFGEILATVTGGKFGPSGGGEEEPGSAAEEGPKAKPVAILDRILEGAAEEGASDVHFLPTEDGGKVRYRIDGVMHDRMDLEKRMYEVVLSRVKILAGLDVTEKVRPQDGRFATEYGEKTLDWRVAFAAASGGETAVLRLLDPAAKLLNLDQYIPEESIRKTFRRWMAAPSGLVVVGGPAGSGKTTVLYSLLREVTENPALKIISVEDPVEYPLKNVVQLPVRRGHGVTPAHLIRSVMRQDPDIFLIGEARERETLDLVIQVALTGHLVLTQMHGATATEIILRLSDMGTPWWLLRESLLGVSVQRLVRLLCQECREEYEIPESVLRDIPVPDPGPKVKAWRPKGCEACGNTGYRGRTAVFEQLEPGEELWKALERGENEERLREVAIEEGLETMWMHGWSRIRRGETSLDEVARLLGLAQP